MPINCSLELNHTLGREGLLVAAVPVKVAIALSLVPLSMRRNVLWRDYSPTNVLV